MGALKRFFKNDAAAGLCLLVATILALIWSNSRWFSTYDNLIGFAVMKWSVRHMVNDGLMTIFFLLVGLEIKREIVIGELSRLKSAALPVAGALGGMILPAVLYASLNSQGAGVSGWGIPMATDIAFAMGVLALVARRAPAGLRIFLLALAVVDDLGAVLVIGLFYTPRLVPEFFFTGCIVFAIIWSVGRWGVKNQLVYWILGAGAWYLVYRSGVHPTVAGVILGLLAPAKVRRGPSPVDQLIEQWQGWVSFAIMPLFAFVNAGVRVTDGVSFEAFQANPVFLGVLLGLVIGKPLGVVGASWLAVRMNWATLPRAVKWPHLWSAGLLAGIGFTMSIFIAGLALKDSGLLMQAKLGILLSSVVSACLGAVAFKFWSAPKKS